jgi:hypothetical protein
MKEGVKGVTYSIGPTTPNSNDSTSPSTITVSVAAT